MGITFQSTQNSARNDMYEIKKKEEQFCIALAGNPNTGKSTVFNALTGLHQHTGNWPGKTVVNARGEYVHRDREFILVDLPGIYSLFASSVEEEVARDYLCFGNPDVTVVVADATCLERNLFLVYQDMELTSRVVLCVNLMDEAHKKHIVIDKDGLENKLGIPVVLCTARSGDGIPALKEAIYQMVFGELLTKPNPVIYHDSLENKVKCIQRKWEGCFFNDRCIQDKNETIFQMEAKKQVSVTAAELKMEPGEVVGINSRWLALRILDADAAFLDRMSEQSNQLRETIRLAKENRKAEDNRQKIRDQISEDIYVRCASIAKMYVKSKKTMYDRDRRIDDVVTSRIFGVPLMLGILALILWITIAGANIPSAILAKVLFGGQDILTSFFSFIHAPEWIHGVLVLGLYRTLAWVVSVMLPPMAIFFPLFTILEDLGYLPRVAFNMDHLFKKACAHGKQCLTMCMGFGCNASGIISCRIIESPRERMIAILTNNFVPCNGRFPTLIAIASIFFVALGKDSFGIVSALVVTGMVILGIFVTLLISFLLSKTILKGIPSSFTLELPPYRVPKIGRLLYTSLIDRTIFVLWRAVIIAAPAGALTWMMGNIEVGGISLLEYIAQFLQPFGNLIGLDGYILMAFILGLPANEIVLPILLMAYLSTGSLIEFDNLDSLKNVLAEHGWTYLTALNMMLFSLLHWPCATTLLTIKKETGSIKWMLVAAVIPTVLAVVVCFVTTAVFRFF